MSTRIIFARPSDVPDGTAVYDVTAPARQASTFVTLVDHEFVGTWLGEVYPVPASFDPDFQEFVAAYIVTDADGNREQVESDHRFADRRAAILEVAYHSEAES